MNHAFHAAAIGAILLTGCATGSKYVEPKPALPAAYSVTLPESKTAPAAVQSAAIQEIATLISPPPAGAPTSGARVF